MTAPPTDRIKCPVRKGVTHAPTFLSGHCQVGQLPGHQEHHASCKGSVTNGCGCVIPCGCTAPGHPIDRPHLYEETPVPLPSPFTIPTAEVAQNGPSSEVEKREPETGDWHTHKTRPWIEGTGEPGSLEVMVRCFAMAAGDLHLSDDGPDDYDETATLAMLGILRASVRRAGELDALLVAHLHEHGTWGRRLVDGIGEVRTYRRPKNVRWDERGTAMAVVDVKMAELGGELPDPHEVVSWLLEAAAVDYYRTGALKALGIDPEDYRHSEKGTRAVDVPVPD